MSKPAIDRRDRLDELNAKLADLGMRGYWQLRHDPSAWNLSSGAGRISIRRSWKPRMWFELAPTRPLECHSKKDRA